MFQTLISAFLVKEIIENLRNNMVNVNVLKVILIIMEVAKVIVILPV